MTIALAELLRATIKKESFISLREEMKTVKDYLLIQQKRFGDRIQAEYKVDERAYDCLVPNFILQPLIENAIIHGLEPKIGNGEIFIEIRKVDSCLKFLIADNGVGMTEDEKEHLYTACRENCDRQAIGLKNVYRRLLLCYGEESIPVVDSEEKQGTRISFSIPC